MNITININDVMPAVGGYRFPTDPRWYAEAVMSTWVSRLGAYHQLLYWQSLPDADADTQAAFNWIAMTLYKGELICNTMLEHFENLEQVFYTAVLVTAGIKIYEWILSIWPYLSGKYRNTLIRTFALTADLQFGIIYATWDISAVTNTSGVNYTPFVEARKPVLMMLNAKVTQAVTEALEEMSLMV